MQASEKPLARKPLLSNQKKVSNESVEKKLAKIEVFYRYHTTSIYRQLKTPVYERLLQLRKDGKAERVPEINKSVDEIIQTLYKYLSLNSKYRHREKVRFDRVPMLKYLKFDFMRLKELLKTKKFMKNYEDLHDQDESDEEQPKKKEYPVDPTFSEQSIINYKKKHSIQGKICMALGYQDLKTCLVEELGWHQNEDHTSNIYDLKFMSKKKNIDYVNLLDRQIVNHFNQNKNITAKFGLCRNIRNLALMGHDPNLLFPRCYDVNDVAELEDFFEDFKCSQFKACLYRFLKNKGMLYPGQAKILRLVMELLSRYLLPFEKKAELISKGKQLLISLQEWKYVSEWSKLQKGQPSMEEQLLQQASRLFEELKRVDPQWSLNCENVWIVKPASMSRGRGIKTFNDLTEMLEYIVGYEISWVIQKYIERPLIVRKKKFDIRLWVLWTDFKPARVWVFEQSYIRFCASIYTPENLRDRSIHLTNNSVTKGLNNQNDGIDDNIMNEMDFGKELEQLLGREVLQSVVKPQMKKIVRESLESVAENVQYRKNSFQILGYDFMVDEELRVWLIEVNSSPSMEYSSAVTTKLVKRGMRDLGLLIQNYITKGKQYKPNHTKQLYGGWKLITPF